jgi:hypothetical protein
VQFKIPRVVTHTSQQERTWCRVSQFTWIRISQNGISEDHETSMLWQKLKLVLGSNGFPKGPLHVAPISKSPCRLLMRSECLNSNCTLHLRIAVGHRIALSTLRVDRSTPGLSNL